MWCWCGGTLTAVTLTAVTLTAAAAATLTTAFSSSLVWVCGLMSAPSPTIAVPACRNPPAKRWLPSRFSGRHDEESPSNESTNGRRSSRRFSTSNRFTSSNRWSSIGEIFVFSMDSDQKDRSSAYVPEPAPPPPPPKRAASAPNLSLGGAAKPAAQPRHSLTHRFMGGLLGNSRW